MIAKTISQILELRAILAQRNTAAIRVSVRGTGMGYGVSGNSLNIVNFAGDTDHRVPIVSSWEEWCL